MILKKDLLENFNLKLYQSLDQLDIYQWHGLFYARNAFFNWGFSNTISKESKTSMLVKILTSPLEFTVFDRPSEHSLSSTPIMDATILDIYSIYKQINDEEHYRNTLDNIYNEVEGVNIDESYHLYGLKNNLYRMENEAFITVDLDSTDEDLRLSFDLWLKNKRDQLKRFNDKESKKKRFTSKDFKNWVSKKVLEYIDLNILCNELNIKTTNQEIGNILFPDEFHVCLEDRVKKVIKPLSKKILSPHNMDALTAAANTIQKRNEKI